MTSLKQLSTRAKVVSAATLAGAAMITFAGFQAATAATPSTNPNPPAPANGKTVPGDNGTVKIHKSTTPDDDRRNEPKVCEFYLVGFNFDGAQQVAWKIRSWPPTGDRSVVSSGSLELGADGHGRTEDMGLPNGHYKLFWKFNGEHGKAKHKVFWVKCAPDKPNPPDKPTPPDEKPTTPPTTPPGTAPKPNPVETDFPVTG